MLGEVADVPGQGGRVAGDVRHGARLESRDRPHDLCAWPRPAAGRARRGPPYRLRGAAPGRPGPATLRAQGYDARLACEWRDAVRSPSTATTDPSGPTTWARKAANSPTPAYRSSTDSPGRGREHLEHALDQRARARRRAAARTRRPPPRARRCPSRSRRARRRRRPPARARPGGRSGSGRSRRRRASGACAGRARRRAGGRTASGCATRARRTAAPPRRPLALEAGQPLQLLGDDGRLEAPLLLQRHVLEVAAAAAARSGVRAGRRHPVR